MALVLARAVLGTPRLALLCEPGRAGSSARCPSGARAMLWRCQRAAAAGGAQAPSQWRSRPRARARAARAASDPEARRTHPVAVPPPGPWGRASGMRLPVQSQSRAIEPRLRSRPSPGYHPAASVSGSLSLWRWLQVACGPQLEATSLDLRRRLPSLNSVEAVAIRSYHDLGSLSIPLAAKTTSPRTHSLTHSEKRDPPSGLHFDEATIGPQ